MTTQFKAGQSGNKNGRPLGTKSKKTAVNDAFRLLNNTMTNPLLSLEARLRAATAIVTYHNLNNQIHAPVSTE